MSTLKCRVEFGGEQRGSTPKSVFSPVGTRRDVLPTARDSNFVSFSLALRTSALGGYFVFYVWQFFTSTIAINAEQLQFATAGASLRASAQEQQRSRKYYQYLTY